MEPYVTSLQHILAELERIDLLIQIEVGQARQIQTTDAEFQGLYIPEHEVDLLLMRPAGMPAWAKIPDALPPETRAAFHALAEEIDSRRKVSALNGTILRLEKLQLLFDLSRLEIDILLVCLAPELDLRYERLYAYLQDDITKKRPSVDLVLNLLSTSFEEKLKLRSCFGPESRLNMHSLIHLVNDPSLPNPPLLNRYIKVDERITGYLLDSDTIDAGILGYCRIIHPDADFNDLFINLDIKKRLSELSHACHHKGQELLLYLQGPYGCGKLHIAEAVCRNIGARLLYFDGGRLKNSEEEDFACVVRLACREALLQNAILYWDGFDELLSNDRRQLLSILLHELEIRKSLAFLAGNVTWEPMDVLHNKTFIRVEVPQPDYQQRISLWKTALKDNASTVADVELRLLAGKFKFTGGQIRDAAATACNLGRWRDPETGEVTVNDLYQACRLQSSRDLSTLASKITPHYTWNDIILPSDRLEQLQEICNYVKYRSLVYDQWGFDRKLAMGKGLNALFAGPSGTGKTMAADIIAGELGLDLYKIDLSSIVSKYIGETEKNLARIFAEADTSNAILFFDEADALFGRRSEIRDSHDRYANIEISYLLQKMEEYEGVVILATNLRKNMDDAFVRRMHFTVEFPFPSSSGRRRIWERIWPDDLPRSPDLDLEFLASRFEVAGGSIRNIALAAAFLAADDGGTVNMGHLTRAVQREYQKMGKVVMGEKFGKYGE